MKENKFTRIQNEIEKAGEVFQTHWTTEPKFVHTFCITSREASELNEDQILSMMLTQKSFDTDTTKLIIYVKMADRKSLQKFNNYFDKIYNKYRLILE